MFSSKNTFLLFFPLLSSFFHLFCHIIFIQFCEGTRGKIFLFRLHFFPIFLWIVVPVSSPSRCESPHAIAIASSCSAQLICFHHRNGQKFFQLSSRLKFQFWSQNFSCRKRIAFSINPRGREKMRWKIITLITFSTEIKKLNKQSFHFHISTVIIFKFKRKNGRVSSSDARCAKEKYLLRQEK